MFSLQLCDLKWQQERHQNRRSRRLLLASRPQMGFSSPFWFLSKSQPQKERENKPSGSAGTGCRPSAHLPCPPREPGAAGAEGERAEETARRHGVTGAETSPVWGKKSSGGREARISGRSGDEGGSASPRGLSAQVRREHSESPASWHLQHPGPAPAAGTGTGTCPRPCPCSRLTCPAPAGPARVSRRGYRPCPRSHPAPARCVAGDHRPRPGGKGPQPAPLPRACARHSLSESASAPWVREDGGDTGRRGAGCGTRGA